MKKLLSVLTIIGVFVFAASLNAQDKTIQITAPFGTGASIEVYDAATAGNLISALAIDTTGITFPFDEPLDNDAVTDPYLVGQVFIEVSSGAGTNWGVSIYTNSNDPTSSSLNHPFDTSQTIRLKYHSTAKFAGTPAPGDPITEAEWDDGNSYSWLLNFTDAELLAGGLANLDVPTLTFTTIIPGATYAERVALTFAIGLHETVTASGEYSNTIGLEVYTN